MTTGSELSGIEIDLKYKTIIDADYKGKSELEIADELCRVCNRNCEHEEQRWFQCRKEPWINIGAGEMLRADHINFDLKLYKRPHGVTDLLSPWLNDFDKGLPKNYFKQILCAHLIEHFYFHDAPEILTEFKNLLRPGGKVIMEGPDTLGILELYHMKHHVMLTDRQVVTSIFGPETNRLTFGSHMAHRSGWTKGIMKEELEKIGMEVVHAGIGLTHGMGRRDFRVEAIKPLEG